MQKIFEAASHPEQDVRFVIMQVLIELARQEYEIINHYFKELCEITAKSAKSDDERVGALALEFWTSLAEEEYHRIQKNKFVMNYIQRCGQQLTLLLLECVQRVSIDNEDDDDDEFGVAISAGACLVAISQLIGNDIMETVLAFVSQYMQNPDWKARYSALLALGAITEGPDTQKYVSVIKPGLAGLVQMF